MVADMASDSVFTNFTVPTLAARFGEASPQLGDLVRDVGASSKRHPATQMPSGATAAGQMPAAPNASRRWPTVPSRRSSD